MCCHCHSPVMKIVIMTSWLVTALAAINVGLAPVAHFNVFATDFMQNNMAGLIIPLHYLIGICGVISLASFIMAFAHGGHKHGEDCKCGSNGSKM